MKKKYYLFLAGILLSFIGIAIILSMQGSSPYHEVNVIETITMEVIDVSDTAVTVRLKNQLNTSYMFGDWFIIEKKYKDKWYYIKPVQNNETVFFSSMAYRLNKTAEHTYQWESFYGRLSSGCYRIIIKVSSDLNKLEPDLVDKEDFAKNNTKEFYMAVEFTIE